MAGEHGSFFLMGEGSDSKSRSFGSMGSTLFAGKCSYPKALGNICGNEQPIIIHSFIGHPLDLA